MFSTKHYYNDGMDTYNQRKSFQLGGNYQSLCQQLKRDLLYHYVKLANCHICHRCGAPIESSEDFSVDHIQAWMYKENARELFLDLENIAFSHKSCNYRSRRQNISRRTKTGFKGVNAVPSGRYTALVHYKGRQQYIGTFDTAEEAAIAYDAKALELYGERAVTNKSLGLV